MAANDSVRVRVMDLITKLLEYVRDGKRDANDVSRVLQVVKDNPNFIQQLFPEEIEKLTVKSRRAKHFLRDWQTLYRQEFGIELDINELMKRIPKRVPGFDRLIVVAQGLTLNQIVSVLKKRMTVWQYTDNLDTITSVRKTDQAYAIWVRDLMEADEELKNKSANDLAQEQINGITLEERLLFHLKYFLETGKHLDEKNWTLCSGSRDSGGDVPRVGWDLISRGLEVCWCYPGSAGSDLRSRAVVS